MSKITGIILDETDLQFMRGALVLAGNLGSKEGYHHADELHTLLTQMVMNKADAYLITTHDDDTPTPL